MVDKNELPQSVLDAAKRNSQPQSTDMLDAVLKRTEDTQYIPWEKVQLPSRGVYYDNKMPDGWIEVKPFSIDVDKMTSNQRIINSGDLLNKIVEACVRLPDNMTVYDLLSGDQFFLLYYLRGITHGAEYEFVVDCPYCKTKSTYEYNLGELSNTMKLPHPEHMVEPFEVKLPYLTKNMAETTNNADIYAMVRLVRVRDVLAMTNSQNVQAHDPLRKARARNKNAQAGSLPQITQAGQESEKAYVDGMKMQITGFKIGDQIYKDARRNALVDRLHQKDTSTIRDFIDSITPGIDTSVEVQCQAKDCGKEYAVPLPFGENFFRSHK
jgi:hypothetical protein